MGFLLLFLLGCFDKPVLLSDGAVLSFEKDQRLHFLMFILATVIEHTTDNNLMITTLIAVFNTSLKTCAKLIENRCFADTRLPLDIGKLIGIAGCANR